MFFWNTDVLVFFYSEMHLSNALLIWIDANIAQLESSNRAEDDLTILKEVCIDVLLLRLRI